MIKSEFASKLITAGWSLILGTATVSAAYFGSVNGQNQKINDIKSDVLVTNNRIDTVCAYSFNQVDRMDKNIQAIARALKVDVTTGSDKYDPCVKQDTIN